MIAYILRRLLLIVPTLLGIMVLNFVIVNYAPGGPVEQILAQLDQQGNDATDRFTGGGGSDGGQGELSLQGHDPEFVSYLEELFQLDKPAWHRFTDMMLRYAQFDFGESYFRQQPVMDLILERLPVSISLGLWSTLLIYLISIPLGIRKAVKDGSAFDVWSSAVIVIGYAIPAFMFAILLIVVFAGGSYLQWFPLRGLVSDNWEELSLLQKIGDYFWHMALPVTAMVIGGFATLTLLTKNAFLDEISKLYVLTARAKGLSEKRVLYGHVFRNAMLIVIAGIPAALIEILLTGSLLIEVTFSLDGLGLLAYESVYQRDYPIVFGTLFIFSLIGLLLKLISDLTYSLIDPRIDFSAQHR